MAGLNFVGNAYFPEVTEGKENVASFEFIPWVLGQCANMKEVRALLAKINITGTPFAENMPAASLHWMIADADEAVTVESMKDGLKIYDNPAGVMTNNPPFDQQMFLLNNYRGLSPRQPENHFSEKLPLDAIAVAWEHWVCRRSFECIPFCPGGFYENDSVSGDSEEESVGQFFHILGSVEQQRGCCEVAEGKYEITIYTSCCNATKGIYYYTTYTNRQITAVDMHREDLDGSGLIHYPMLEKEQILRQN